MTVDVLTDIDLSCGDVLTRYWQKKPVALANAVDVSELVPDTDTLISIITETNLPSRLITGQEGFEFRVTQGPFESFQKPKCAWTVVIHALEQIYPEYETLRKRMVWLPAWRFEDCMLSWANTGGSVGRHYDQFSVFLVQLNGRRCWQVGPEAVESTPSLPDQELNLVAPSNKVWEHIFEPGDVLYLPPRVIHYGKSMDEDCMTLSIGFRAPDAVSLLATALEIPAAQAMNIRFEDQGRKTPKHPACISDEDQERAKRAILEYLDQPGVLADVLGLQVTSPYLTDYLDELSDQDLADQISSTILWELDPNCRMAYSNTTLYINGERTGDQTPFELLQLADYRYISRSSLGELDPIWSAIAEDLIRRQWLIPAENSN